MHIYFVTIWSLVFKALDPYGDVFCIRGEKVVSHLLKPDRTVGLQRFLPSHDPRRENQVRVTECVVAVKVCDEEGGDSVDGEMRSAQLALDTGSGIEKEHLFTDNDCCGRAGGLGIGPRHARAEHYDHGAVFLDEIKTVEAGRQDPQSEK
jgi:hypothetical protein